MGFVVLIYEDKRRKFRLPVHESDVKRIFFLSRAQVANEEGYEVTLENLEEGKEYEVKGVPLTCKQKEEKLKKALKNEETLALLKSIQELSLSDKKTNTETDTKSFSNYRIRKTYVYPYGTYYVWNCCSYRGSSEKHNCKDYTPK
jgi:hypothetical protein